jgi:hypothetical protein
VLFVYTVVSFCFMSTILSSFLLRVSKIKQEQCLGKHERRSAAGEKRERFHAELEHFLQRTMVITITID